MEIKPGDIYWLTTKSDIPHPHVVISIEGDDVVVCPTTTNMSKAAMPGNVILDANDGGLEKESIAEVSKQTKVTKLLLGDYIGTISESKLAEILAGGKFVQRSFFR